jgi:thiol-disulfide isomerase/thioredoxin
MKNLPLRAAVALLAVLVAGELRAGALNGWSTEPKAAFAAAKKADQLVLVDAYAEWCGWCKVLEREVFPHPEFLAATRDFVKLRIDVEDGAEGSELADRYGAWSLPTLLILEPSGALVGVVEGYAPVGPFVGRLRAELSLRERVLDGYRRALAGGDVETLRRTAIDFYERQDGARAAALLEKLLGSTSLEPREEAWTRYFLADAWRMAGDAERARVAARSAETAAARATVEPELDERLDLLPFWIAEAARECGAAAGALAAFEKDHPESPFLDEARRALTRLRADSGPRCT